MQVDAEFIRNLNEPLKKIVKDAGNAIMEVYKKDDFESAIKSDGSPVCLLYTSPSPRDAHESRMPSSA